MLFEKLIEQHRVDRFVPHCLRFAITVRSYKVWIDLRHFLGDQPKRERARGINLLPITKAHRPEREDRLAGLGYRPDLVLVAAGGGKRPDLVIGIDVNRPAA